MSYSLPSRPHWRTLVASCPSRLRSLPNRMTRRNSISSARVSTVSEIKKRIRSAGYWETIVRPARFVRHRIEPITALLPLLRRCHVEVRGWDFPHISDHDPIITGADFVEQESEWQHHAEAWRLYQ